MQDFTDYSDVRIETKNLILKKAQFEDWESLYHNIWCQEESAKYMLWNVTRSEEEARERMRKTLCFQKVQKYAFIVYEKSSGAAIGFAGMREVEPGVFEDTGVAIGPAFCGRGYGKQILNALVKEAKNCGASRFMASARVKNLASHKLQMSCGFEFESFSEEREDPRTGEVYIVENNVKYL